MIHQLSERPGRCLGCKPLPQNGGPSRQPISTVGIVTCVITALARRAVAGARISRDDQDMVLVADSASSTAALFTLVGALGGVLLTSVVALRGYFDRRWQVQDWNLG